MFTIFICSLQYVFTNKESFLMCLNFNAFKKPLPFEKAHFLHFYEIKTKPSFLSLLDLEDRHRADLSMTMHYLCK